MPSPPPPALRRPREVAAQGRLWSDDYAWLRAENWRAVLSDPAALPAEIRGYLEAENAFCDATLAPLEDLRRELAREMRARIKEDDSEPPAPDGPWSYYARFREGGQHRIACRRPREGGQEAILIDGDALAEGRSFFQLGALRHAPDHALVAWSADDLGSELYAICARELATGRDLPDRIENTTGEFVWTADSAALIYVAQDAEHRPYRILLHRLGAPQADDALLFEERDPAWFLSLRATRLGRRAFIHVHGHDAREHHTLDLANPLAPPRLIAARRPGFRYEPVDHGDVFFIKSNARVADYEIVVAPADAPEEANWRPFLPGIDGRLIESFTAFREYLALIVREANRPRLIVRDLGAGEAHEIAFPDPTYALRLETTYEFDSRALRFSYSSLGQPQETYDYDMRTRRRDLVKTQPTSPDFDPRAYVVEAIEAPAADGARVPVSILRRRDAARDGTAPLYVYGYGAYGVTIDAGFAPNRFSLVDRGFTFAILHVRGGSENGMAWYEGGKLANKANTFTDFLAATRELVRLGYGGPVVAHGGSAGGLLMGAVANMAPDLFAGIVADVPFVDALNTMLDASLPLTPPEWLEWGDPARDPAAFAAIRSYSPYENVAAQRYPAILALAGLTDPRVTYWEPAKWIAKLRATMTGGGPALLRTAMEAGHGGSPGRFDRLEEVARIYAFAIAAAEGRFVAAQ